MSEYSLIELMKNDFCFDSLKEAREETKKSKQTLSKNADKYNTRFSSEIEKGTKRRQLLLEVAGVRDDTPEAEAIFKNNNEFLPTVKTPILNFLFFLDRDFKEVESSFKKLKVEYESKYGNSVLGEGNISHAKVDTNILKNDMAKTLESIARGVDESNIENYETGKEVPHMEKYIYQNMDSGTFGKLKKLKALSMSSNPAEAKAAWIKCMDICDTFGLNFEDIPTKYD